MRECLNCGYVSQNDEIGENDTQRRCPQCGSRFADKEEVKYPTEKDDEQDT